MGAETDLSNGGLEATLAFDGDEFFLEARNFAGGGAAGVRGQRISLTGVPLGAGLTLAADHRRYVRRQIRVVESLKRRKIGPQARRDELEQPLRLGQVFEAMLSEVAASDRQVTTREVATLSSVATLLGLILMLGNLSNAEAIGPSMAMALIGTLYGVATANFFAIPMAEKAATRSHSSNRPSAARIRRVESMAVPASWK